MPPTNAQGSITHFAGRIARRSAVWWPACAASNASSLSIRSCTKGSSEVGRVWNRSGGYISNLID